MTLEPGSQDESIRAKIRPFLKDPSVTDEVLIQQMSVAASAEKERDKNLKNNSKSKSPAASVVSVSDSSNEKKVPKESLPLSDFVAAINAIKSEVEPLRGEVRKRDTTNGISSCRGPRRLPLCSGCFENKKEYCNLCFNCGSDSHFVRGCWKSLNERRLLARDNKQS